MSLRPGPKESVFLLALRIGLAGVFAFAAYQKLKSPAALLEFSNAIEAFKLIGAEQQHLITIATYAVPWAEALCAAFLLIGLWTRAAALLLSVALAGFIAAILSALDRGLDFPCGCFGKINFPCSPKSLTMCGVWRNVALLVPAVYILARGPGRMSVDRLLAPRRPAPDEPGATRAHEPDAGTWSVPGT